MLNLNTNFGYKLVKGEVNQPVKRNKYKQGWRSDIEEKGLPSWMVLFVHHPRVTSSSVVSADDYSKGEWIINIVWPFGLLPLTCP